MDVEQNPARLMDKEKSSSIPDTIVTVSEVPQTDQRALPLIGPTESRLDTLSQKIASWIASQGLEGHGISPVHESQRTDPRLYQVFTTWFAANANILTFGSGSVGPAAFGLGIKDAFLTIIVVDIIMCVPPAIFTLFGPKLGTRSMVQSRFSWGYYGAILPSIFNVLTMQGFLVINCIIGGQTLASVSSHLDATTGIVITGLISLALTFCGYQILHWYEMISWIPNVITFIIMLGVGGKTLANVPTSATSPATAASMLTFASSLAVHVLAWCTITPDYGIFHDAKGSSMRIFIYAYLGFLLSCVPAHLIGAAFTAAAPYVSSWDAGLNSATNVGGLVAAVLEPTGGFGKFLLVVLSLTTPTASALSMYTACTSFMTISPVFARVPRFVFALVSTAVLIPVGIVGATQFYATFTQILSFIGYWIAPFLGIVLTEHFFIRRGSWKAYSPMEAWNDPHHPNLAKGYAAIFTFLTSIGLIVVTMSQDWWTGPVAKAGTGDIALFVSFVYSVLAFSIARTLELRMWRKALRH